METCEICGKQFKDKAGLSGHMRFKHSAEENSTDNEPKTGQPQTMAVIRKQQSPLEALIKDMELPALVNGEAEIFDAGVRYGVKSVLVGVRVAQELSAMGVQQASPVIQMAKEMRESEGQAARTIAGELAQATLESNREIIAAIRGQAVAQSPNPMQAMMSQAMGPLFQQAVGGLMKMFTPQAAQPQLAAEQPQPGAEQEVSPSRQSQPPVQEESGMPFDTPPIEQHNRDEWEEE